MCVKNIKNMQFNGWFFKILAILILLVGFWPVLKKKKKKKSFSGSFSLRL